MNSYAAFLRGINVGGKSMLAMKRLVAFCEDIGFKEVRTYLNSGNVVFRSSAAEETLRTKLERTLLKEEGRPIKVIVRTLGNVKSLVDKNPFPDAKPGQVGVMLLTAPVSGVSLSDFTTPGREKVVLGEREVFVHYPDGMGRSKLKWPTAVADGTMRNINTLSRLAEFAEV